MPFAVRGAGDQDALHFAAAAGLIDTLYKGAQVAARFKLVPIGQAHDEAARKEANRQFAEGVIAAKRWMVKRGKQTEQPVLVQGPTLRRVQPLGQRQERR